MIHTVTTSTQSIIQAAARNNAEWCAVMSRAHGVAGEFGEVAWVAAARTPPYFPDAVTLVPGAEPAALAARIDTSRPSASVKDSFADVDLTEEGFEVLFDAQWIHRSPRRVFVRPALAWEVITEANGLRDWAQAWDNGCGHADLFRPKLLDNPDTYVIAGHGTNGRVVAGAVASRSYDVVGVSNVFTREGDPDTAWPLVLDAVHSLFPDMPMIGYEHGDELEAAVRNGFEIVGPLRVWTHQAWTMPGTRAQAAAKNANA